MEIRSGKRFLVALGQSRGTLNAVKQLNPRLVVGLGGVLTLALLAGCETPARARLWSGDASPARGSFALVASPPIEASPGVMFDMNGPGGVGPESVRRDAQLAVGTTGQDRQTQYFEPEPQPSLEYSRRVYLSNNPNDVTYFPAVGQGYRGYRGYWHSTWGWSWR